MRKWFNTYKVYFKEKEVLQGTVEAILLLIISLFVNFYAGTYATEQASSPVTDIILSNVRVYDVDSVFVYGSIIFWIFIILLCLFKPRQIPFTIKSIALFVMIRSLFVSLTHIAPFPTHMIVDMTGILGKFTFGGDLFFSGHTGVPFLLALVFWREKKLRYLFIVLSIVFGIIVLLAHIHYSIDVLAAFFITYSIHAIAVNIFKKDRQMFLSDRTLPLTQQVG